MPEFDEEEVVVKPKSTPEKLTNDDLDVDWGDADAVTTTDGLDRIIPGDAKSRVRFAVMPDSIIKPKAAWLHFIHKDGKKLSYRCLSKRDRKNVIIEEAECCKRLNSDEDQRAQLSIVCLAVKYTNADAKTGKYPKDYAGEIKWELGWVKLSGYGFKVISELPGEDGDVYDIDIAMGKKESGIGYDYIRAAQPAKYRKNPELVKEVEEAARKFSDGVVLTKRLGKVVTPLEMKALLAGNAALAKTGGDIDNTDDL